ncbi:sugar ABC transporter ATP-binding protein [Conexibacter stalactiti]|uniref:Sugar ABC transporter ATP-binding protein n=1 Tax=Conexibacter stalactiti TaxID=1940611 RepID=A0ABU4HZ26_9ACTN|nr:sugar ABC transporter ATP-binding protein [Conexibacter stalactiti]MDW5598139.1 sugar ABC transporter ATP-binding protein [Conexibacter stalactiti]MEC5038781.1 sugar ABC transporter ATP-binding protein [Conexibacter stalactiti]
MSGISTTTADPGAAPDPQGPPAIEVAGVSKRFGSTCALVDVSFSIPRGEARALLGRNGAGKSTLVSLLTGLDTADEGELRVAGDELRGQDPRIGCVFQRSSLIPALTAAENVLLQHYPRRAGGPIDWSALARTAREHLDAWGIGGLADRPVERLEPIQRKVVEICRALVVEPAVLILDEPTAGLDHTDAERLFAVLDELRARGVTIVYISHHLDEIYRVCDSATVLRDARHVLTSPLAELPMDALVTAMVGDEPPAAAAARARAGDASGERLLSVRDVRVGERVGPVSFELRAGECLGIAGLEGSGKADFARSLAGLLPRAGEVTVRGRAVAQGSVPAALDAGIGFVPEDRHVDGLVPQLDVSENATMTVAPRLARRLLGVLPGVSRRGERDRVFGELARQWRIVAASPRQEISQLSGGNQQKCVMARALATGPDLLVLVNPTAGVDVSAKGSIVTTLGEVLDRGAGVLVASEDPDDFVLCDRIVVMFKGRIHTELTSGWTEADLVSAMQGAEL